MLHMSIGGDLMIMSQLLSDLMATLLSLVLVKY